MEALGINLPKLLYQIVNFALMAWILYSLLYKRVLAILDERRQRIEQSLKDADQVKQQLANARRDYEAEIAKARQEAAGILAKARDSAKSQEAEIIAQARKEADRIREDARKQADLERLQSLSAMKKQVAELVTLTASRVLQDELKVRGHDKLIDESLAALGRQN